MKKVQVAKGYRHAAEFPASEILESVDRRRYSIIKKIGFGGFGVIYTARQVGSSPNEEYVAKVEPIGNGPLFNEFHALQKIARPNIIQTYLKGKRLAHLAIPEFIANGIHKYKGKDYRFIIIPKYGKNLQTYLEENGSNLDESTVYCVAKQMIDALECIHHHGYVHADLKAGNILFAANSNKIDKVYLIDYGLAAKIFLDEKHKVYKPEKKNAHNGTLLYTSLDAHEGADPSRRGDFQILGFCMYEWLTGSLPWTKYSKNKEQVKHEKEVLLKSLSKIPFETLKTYFKTIEKLKYDEEPDYEKLRRIFQDAKYVKMTKPVVKRTGESSAKKKKLGSSVQESRQLIKKNGRHLSEEGPPQKKKRTCRHLSEEGPPQKKKRTYNLSEEGPPQKEKRTRRRLSEEGPAQKKKQIQNRRKRVIRKKK